MGTLMGHILPGTFFALFAIWWGFCTAIKYFHSRCSTKKSRKPIPYQSKATYSCSCCPYQSLRQIPLESYLKIICVSIGILGEAVTGIRHNYNERLNRKVWTIIEVNAQHITMFFSFGLASLIEILVHAKYSLPKGSEFLANMIAFGVEGFLFHFHLHGRDEIDIHVHTLLVYNIAFCILALLWEFNRPNQILATYCRIAATLLQGVWFYAAGFILYFPSNDPYWRWEANHGSILIITVMFIWFALLICIFLFIQSTITWSILKRRFVNLNQYCVINDDEEEEDGNDETRKQSPKSNNHQLKALKTNNGNTAVHLDDDESDSEIEFEQSQPYSSKI